jgi:hypothetical protein
MAAVLHLDPVLVPAAAVLADRGASKLRIEEDRPLALGGEEGGQKESA